MAFIEKNNILLMAFELGIFGVYNSERFGIIAEQNKVVIQSYVPFTFRPALYDPSF